MIDNWWSPGAIKFSREQVEFLLAHYHLLETGLWPPECRETGYEGASSNRLSNLASYQAAIEMKVDIDARLGRLSQLEHLVICECCIEGAPEYEASRKLNLHYDIVVERKESGLNKMVDWRESWNATR